MPSGDGYHVIVAILLLLHEAPKDEPAQQHGVANGFLEPLGWASRGAGGSPIVFVVGAGRPEKVSVVSERTCFLPEKICPNGGYAAEIEIGIGCNHNILIQFITLPLPLFGNSLLPLAGFAWGRKVS
jgi:hypothetical protein